MNICVLTQCCMHVDSEFASSEVFAGVGAVTLSPEHYKEGYSRIYEPNVKTLSLRQ